MKDGVIILYVGDSKSDIEDAFSYELDGDDLTFDLAKGYEYVCEEDEADTAGYFPLKLSRK